MLTQRGLLCRTVTSDGPLTILSPRWVNRPTWCCLLKPRAFILRTRSLLMHRRAWVNRPAWRVSLRLALLLVLLCLYLRRSTKTPCHQVTPAIQPTVPHLLLTRDASKPAWQVGGQGRWQTSDEPRTWVGLGWCMGGFHFSHGNGAGMQNRTNKRTKRDEIWPCAHIAA